MTILFRHAFVCASLSLAVSAPVVAQTLLGPDPYLSIMDRPAGFLTGSSVVEDLEDGSLDYGITTNVGTVYGPASNADSVDADDGVIDGLGRDGRSLFGFGAVTFTFPGTVREAGVVWTDGSCNAPVSFEAFGPGMVSLGFAGPFNHADCSNAGETGEDRFYGVQAPGGIVAIRVTSGGNTSFEVDHIQFDTLGTSYCTTVPNSTGETGIQTVVGRATVADDEVTLVASRLPNNTFGFFLCSLTQSFVANAGGSQGNLCLGGAIGRFNASIFNTGNTGSGTLRIDVAAIPSPTGLTSIQPGETWSFQTWHRDSVAGTSTSNFTDGVEVQFN